MKTFLQIRNASMVVVAAVCVCLIAIHSATAAIRYVNVNNLNPSPPYTNWATAARVIQEAIDVAEAGDEIVVTNGIYAQGARAVHGATNRVAVDKRLTVRSVNGPKFTVIEGRHVPGTIIGQSAIRCAYLTNGASLFGFTLTNGATRGYVLAVDYAIQCGGGVWCESGSAVLSNCVLAANAAAYVGGGMYHGTAHNSIFRDNSAIQSGGGAFEATLSACILATNWAGSDGGGTGLSNAVQLRADG